MCRRHEAAPGRKAQHEDDGVLHRADQVKKREGEAQRQRD